jgi:hypothetical protein
MSSIIRKDQSEADGQSGSRRSGGRDTKLLDLAMATAALLVDPS